MKIVAKFGGTSVGSVRCIQNCAKLISTLKNHKIVVVVSAMAGITDQLIQQTEYFSEEKEGRECDFVVSAGEQITAGLFALALQKMGVDAIAVTGWQVPIITTDCFGNADIINIDPTYLETLWAEGKIPVVAGFQGVTEKGAITTLGRGGSDMTAVALAATLKADECRIYKDVEAVYTADPNLVPSAQKIPYLTYEEMSILAQNGCKVLQGKAIDYAKAHKIPLAVLSTFIDDEGTRIVDAIDLDYRLASITRKANHIICVGHNIHKGPYLNMLIERGISAEPFPHYLRVPASAINVHALHDLMFGGI